MLVCGGRNYRGKDTIFDALDGEYIRHGDLLIIHGAAPGADTLARLWAEDRQMPHLPFPADWAKYGKAAGPKRNRRMLLEGKPEIVLAFPTTDSKGTWDMVEIAEDANIEVRIYEVCALRSVNS